MGGFWRWIVGFVGLVLLGAGIWETVHGSSAGSVIAVIAAGALLLVSPLVVDRVTELAIGPDGVSLGLVSDIANVAPQTAQILGASDLATLAESYALVRENLAGARYRDARIVLQDLLVDRAASLAMRRKFDQSEVRKLFMEGAPVVRVLALGLMRGDPSLADVDTIRAAITESRSGNEQYHGLLLAESRWRGLTDSDRSSILAAIDDARIEPGSDREVIAGRIRTFR